MIMGQVSTVLIVDNCDDDRYLVKRALVSHQGLKLIGEMESGNRLIRYLAGEGAYADRFTYPIPDVLLVDAVMPQAGALEILQWLQDHPIPQLSVFVLSGSVFHEECEQLVDMGARACYEKTGNLRELDAIIEEIDRFSHSGRFDESLPIKRLSMRKPKRF